MSNGDKYYGEKQQDKWGLRVAEGWAVTCAILPRVVKNKMTLEIMKVWAM